MAGDIGRTTTWTKGTISLHLPSNWSKNYRFKSNVIGLREICLKSHQSPSVTVKVAIPCINRHYLSNLYLHETQWIQIFEGIYRYSMKMYPTPHYITQYHASPCSDEPWLWVSIQILENYYMDLEGCKIVAERRAIILLLSIKENIWGKKISAHGGS